jgi:hypothetical protein
MSCPPSADSKGSQQDSSENSGKVLQNPQPPRNQEQPAPPTKSQRPPSTGIAGTKGGTTMDLKAEKSSKQRSREQCKARTKAGGPCPAPALEGGLCFCHAHPDRLAELGRQGGQKNRRWKTDVSNLPERPLTTVGEVSELLEETINRVRQRPFDLRAANAIGFLAGILLKALDQRLEERLAHLEAVLLARWKRIGRSSSSDRRRGQQDDQPPSTRQGDRTHAYTARGCPGVAQKCAPSGIF